MIAFTVAFELIVTAVIAALIIAMPSLVRATLPLGVSVPQSRVDEPVVRSAVRAYRWTIVVLWVVCAGVGVVVATARPELALGTLPLLFLLLAGVAYVVVRRRIIVAKRDGGWYDGVPTRLVAEAAPHRTGHPSIGWLLAALIVVCATAAVGVAVYPSLPAVIPTHWDAAGRVNATAVRSLWSVFGTTLVTLGMVVGLYGLSWLVVALPGRTAASDTPEQAAARSEAQRHLGTTGLGILALALALGMGAGSVASWLAPRSPGVMSVTLLVTLGLTALALIVIVVRYARTVSRADPRRSRPEAARADARRTPADAPDDDRYWKLGAFYVNRDDPAVFVPKRFGIGWTINLGSIGGMVFGAVTILILIVVIAAPLVSAATH